MVYFDVKSMCDFYLPSFGVATDKTAMGPSQNGCKQFKMSMRRILPENI